MLDADWRVHDVDGAVLVAVVVESAAPTPRAVSVTSRLDGAVMPPRRRGLPEPGWSDRGFEGVVPAAGRLAIGFACRGAPVEPPVEVVDAGRVEEDAATAAERSPTDLLRDLGSPAPPRDAVPSAPSAAVPSVPSTAVGTGSEPDVDVATEPTVDGAVDPADARAEDADVDSPPPSGSGRTGDAGRETTGTGAPSATWAPGGGGEPPVPGQVGNWLDNVASRVDRTERLAAARDLDAAATAVEDAGGLDAVEALLGDVADDEAALRAVVDRATTLVEACRVRDTVPVEAYRRLA